MKYIREIYRNEFLLSFVLGLIATWILSGSAEAAAHKPSPTEQCVSLVRDHVDSEDAPAAIEACEYRESMAEVLKCSKIRNFMKRGYCVRDEVL